ncbi:MAG: LAGLIDADG family homing endonuclease, partial [Candidatus Aenigmatarchaeota archaeon]
MPRGIKNVLLESAKELNPDLGYILGVMKGDGFLSKAGRSGCSFLVGLNTIDKDFVLEFKSRIEKVFKVPTSLYYFKPVKQWRFYFTSKEIGIFLKNFDIKKVLNASSNGKATFLRGLFDSEGSVSAYNLDELKRAERRITFVNKDKKLVKLVKDLL